MKSEAPSRIVIINLPVWIESRGTCHDERQEQGGAQARTCGEACEAKDMWSAAQHVPSITCLSGRLALRG